MKKIFLLCFISIFLFGCSSFSDKEQKPDQIQEVSVPKINVSDESNNILDSTEKIQSEKPNEVVMKESYKIENSAQNISKEQKKIDKLKDNVSYLLSQIQIRDQKINKLKSKSRESWREFLEYGLYIGGALSLLGVFSMIFGSQIPMLRGIGFSLLASGLITVIIVYVFLSSSQFILPIGIVLILGIIGYGIYQLVCDKDNEKGKAQIQKELVATIDYLKENDWNKNIISKLQSPECQKRVSELRKK